MGNIFESQEVIPENLLGDTRCDINCLKHDNGVHKRNCLRYYRTTNQCCQRYERIGCVNNCGNAAYHMRYFSWMPILRHYEWICQECKMICL